MSIEPIGRRRVIWPLPDQRKSWRWPVEPGLPPWRRWLARVMLAILALILMVVAVGGVVFWRLSATVTSYNGAHFNHHQNGIWLEHSWAGQSHSPAEYDALANQLQKEQVSYVFAHVGPLNSDGSIPDTVAPNAATLVALLQARLPHLHVLAWIGQDEAASGEPASDTVNLSDSAVRAKIAATSAHFVRDLGFDGVQYDIEPITNNNPRFLDLLDATREELPSGAILSTIGEKWAPNAHVADVLQSQGRAGAWWTSYFYAEVAAHVDQIVPLVYNSAMPSGRLYEFFVQQETEHILDAVRSASRPPQVLIGLPTYTGDSFWFHASAENVSTGLHGVIDGLNSNHDTTAFAGVALYRFATTTGQDWSDYDSLWLGD